MRPTPVRRGLEAGAKLLLAPLIRPGAAPDGWGLLSWDYEQGLCLTYARDDAAIYIEIEPRDDARDCYGRTRHFNVNARPVNTESRDVGPGGRGLVEWAIATLAGSESVLDGAERPRGTRRGAMREILVEQVLIPERQGQYYINPYVGCTIGCSFCYVGPRADLSRRIEGLPELDWGHYLDVKVNAAEVLAREIHQHPPGLVRMSPILTDPYQPAERKYRITRQCLEVLAPSGFTPCILTRGARIVEDLDVLSRFEHPMAGFSIPTDDDRMRALFEPGADPIDDRIDALRQLHEAGVTTLVVIQPMLPMNVDRLIELIGPYTDIVRVDRMHFEFASPIYEAHGLEWANTETFFRATYEKLVSGLRAHGAITNEMDDMAALLREAVARRANGARAR